LSSLLNVYFKSVPKFYGVKLVDPGPEIDKIVVWCGVLFKNFDILERIGSVRLLHALLEQLHGGIRGIHLDFGTFGKN
jgi:hypothetical protein